MVNCSRKRKDECNRSPSCTWVVGKGCRSSVSKRRSVRKSPVRKSPVACSRKRKDDCLSPCEWIVGKGCRKGSSRRVTSVTPSVSLVADIRPASAARLYKRRSMSRPIELDEMKCISGSNIPLKPVQINAVEQFMRGDELLVVFGTGVGKTLTSIVASQCFLENNPDARVVVIAPKSVIPNFINEMRKYDPSIITLDPRYEFFTPTGFYIKYKDNLRGKCDNVMLIIDEVHNMRNERSAIYQTISNCSRVSRKRLFLTATPFVNKIKDVVNITQMLVGDAYIVDNDNVFDILNTRVIYQPKVLNEFFPSVVEEHLYIDMDPAFRDEYELVVAEALRFIDPKRFYNGYRRAVNFLGDKYASHKIDTIIDIMKAHSERKSLIFTHWIEYGVDIIKRALDANGISYGVITGDVSMRERQRIVNAYNNNQIQALLITAAGGEGIDLRETENIFVMDPTWNPAGIEQIIGRGIRFQSHINLPPERQVVYVYYLILKEDDIDATDPVSLENSISGDVILYRFIENKKLEQNAVYEKLSQISF